MKASMAFWAFVMAWSFLFTLTLML